ncbi:hypothetical protein HAX54_038701 [Datura stramonium]|uniref:AT-hook motif nuclear-localized protein n=1 Tax=Datura stramonium TaxID=4076 RepID=A0ABS8RQ22_DATST|nr:hypothetical protein [Datura stramonium]
MEFICNATLQPTSNGGGTVTYEGLLEIISLTGSFLRSESNGSKGPSGLSVSLAGSDGRVLGGGVAGMLMAATPGAGNRESPSFKVMPSSDSSGENGDSPFHHEPGPYSNAGQPMHELAVDSQYANGQSIGVS